MISLSERVGGCIRSCKNCCKICLELEIMRLKMYHQWRWRWQLTTTQNVCHDPTIAKDVVCLLGRGTSSKSYLWTKTSLLNFGTHSLRSLTAFVIKLWKKVLSHRCRHRKATIQTSCSFVSMANSNPEPGSKSTKMLTTVAKVRIFWSATFVSRINLIWYRVIILWYWYECLDV